jgi:CheY-like chemotaxis protein
MPNFNAKLLVVDDDPLLVEIMNEMLSALGYDIRKAYDVDEAVSVAKKFRPDCVVTGLIMPRMGGFQEAIAILQFLPTCKFVFMSGRAHEPEIRAGHEHLAQISGLFLRSLFSARPVERPRGGGLPRSRRRKLALMPVYVNRL